MSRPSFGAYYLVAEPAWAVVETLSVFSMVPVVVSSLSLQPHVLDIVLVFTGAECNKQTSTNLGIEVLETCGFPPVINGARTMTKLNNRSKPFLPPIASIYVTVPG